jgi:DNA mismatch repair protein MutS2
MPMTGLLNEKTARDLELDRVRELVASYASTALGENAIRSLAPTVHRDAIDRAVAEVGEALAYLEHHGRFSLGAVHDLEDTLQEAREVGFLDGGQLLEVRESLEAARAVRAALTALEDGGRLAQLGHRLSDPSPLITALHRALDDRGEVRDDASPRLRELTQSIATLERRVSQKLRAVAEKSPELVTDPLITRRGGRLVLPIRSGATGAMAFVVHDRSATGQTLYAEPASLVPDNNRIAEAAGEIREERNRILRELTAALRAQDAALRRDQAVLAHVDSLFGRAAYARDRGCAFPVLGTRIKLRNARHPLLPPDRVVPISLSLGDGRRVSVITGPNTGGKTVTLKTIGLLTLMTQAGIPVPCSPDSELILAQRVRTDIGDEQSIQQNLSTFSAHMRTIVGLLQDADDRSLILLDELGAGTDPQEGAALGLAILEELMGRDAWVVVTTHLTPLKYFAIRHPEVGTASMEFDAETLAPTFRIIEGVPGRSNAFLIAQGLGLPGPLIDHARSFLTQGEIRAEDIIDELQRERQALMRSREEAEAQRRDAEALRRDLEAQQRAFAEDREASLAQRLRDAERLLRTSQQEAEAIIARLRSGAQEEEARREVRRLAEMREQLGDLRAGAREPVSEERLPREALHEGAEVRVRSLDANGRIEELDDGRALIDLDGVRVRTTIDDLAPPAKGRPQPEADRQRRRRPRARLSSTRVPLELNVRGMTAAEALREVEGYLDQLLRTDLHTGRVLHGKGTGALRDAVRTYLDSCTFVSSFGAAPPSEGGDGVTVFTLSGGA